MSVKNLWLRLAFLLLILIFSQGFSHDYWLLPEKFIISKGDSLIVHLFVGDEFEPELERPLQKYITKRFELLTSHGSFDLLSEFPDSTMPILSKKIEFEGYALLNLERDFAYIELSNSQFSDYLKHEDLLEVEKLREKSGKRSKERERYARFIKSFVKIGEAKESDLYRKILGQKLEIVLLQNPSASKSGDVIEAQILFEGKPLINKIVMAYNKDMTGKVSKIKAKTDSRGIAKFKLEGEGFWIIRLVHLIPCDNCEKVDWESFWASYSFELQ
ncbi:MAG: DUF4198 domain-containing protein [bacterium]